MKQPHKGEMTKYRKRPVVIEAALFDGSKESLAPLDIPAGRYFIADDAAFITTLEGVMRADTGDYVIKGVAGEFYPCKPDIFAKTYEAV